MSDNHEQDNSLSSLIKINPVLLTQMVVTATTIKLNNPTGHELEIIYLTVKQYLSSPKIQVDKEALPSTIFACYLDVYRGFKVCQAMEQGNVNHEADPTRLYNEAALSLFDLYLQCPNDILVRRLLPITGEALREVIVAQQSSHDIPLKESLNSLSTITMLTQTLTSYVKGKRRRKSYAYINWLKIFLQQALNTEDLSSLITRDETLKKVIQQISTHASFIMID